MSEFTVSTCLATRNPILFGAGTHKRAGEELRHLGVTKALVVCDKGVKSAGLVEKVLNYIHGSGIETVVYDNVQADPPDWSCEEAADIGRREKVNGVVAIGGGSSLDTGKAAKILLTNPSPISRYYLAHEDVQPDLAALYPIIVIPTTAGTGSEATPGGVITDTVNNLKQNVPCQTDLGIVDPELTLGLPPFVTATTAIDALCHSIEAYTSNKPNALSDILNLEAISNIFGNLPKVIENPKDIAAREKVQLGATLGGLGLMGPFCHIPHEIGLHIGMLFHMPHGAACGATLPEALEFIAPSVPDRMKTLIGIIAPDYDGDYSPESLGKAAYDAVANLYRITGFPKLSDYASRESILVAVPRIMDPYPFVHSPRDLTAADVEAILLKAYDR